MIPRFLRERVVRQFFTGPQVPLKFRKILGHSFLNHPLTVENLYLENFLSIFSPEMQDMLFSEPVRTRLGEGSPYGASLDYFNTPNRASFLDRMLYHDLKTYLLELLMKQDNMSMATSVESRVPFLDHRLIEFTATLPGHLKLKGRQGKQILRRAFKDLLPESILKRKKMGFPVPIEIWLRKDFNSYAASILLDEETQRRGYFLPSCVERILREHREGVADHSSRIWTLVNFELWNRIFIDQRGVV
jgi:asparagine synthase (glutamine-hydrolysing)